MSTHNANTPQAIPFSLQIKNYPQTLMINEYELIFIGTNNLASNEKFQIKFPNTNKQFEFDKTQENVLSEGISFNPSESKEFSIKLKPTVDGMVNLDYVVNKIDFEEYEIMVWKIRNQVEQELINKIMETQLAIGSDLNVYRQQLPQSIDITDIEQFDKGQAQSKIAEIDATAQQQVNQMMQTEAANEAAKKAYAEAIQAAQAAPQMDGNGVPIMPTAPVFAQVADLNVLLQNKEISYLQAARGVFMQDPAYGYEILKLITNEEMKNTWLYHFIGAGIIVDHNATLTVVNELGDVAKKNEYLKMLAFATAPVDANQSLMIALNLDNQAEKDQIIKEIIFAAADSNPEFASNAVYQINDSDLQQKVLFEIIKRWAAQDKQKAVNALTSLINNILSGANQAFIQNCMIFLAHLTSPQSVYDLIKSFANEQKKTLKEQLKQHLKVEVKEKRTREIGVLLYQHSISFSSYISGANNPAIRRMIEINGLISTNLISPNINSNLLILAPYRYNFAIGGAFQQALGQIAQETGGGKTVSYIIYPSQDLNDPTEWENLVNLINTFVKNNDAPSPFTVLNFDLIPYLSKATVFVEDGDQTTDIIVQKLKKTLGAQANVLKNNTFFTKGDLKDKLSHVLMPPQFNIHNIVLTYNFFAEYELLKAFLTGLI